MSETVRKFFYHDDVPEDEQMHAPVDDDGAVMLDAPLWPNGRRRFVEYDLDDQEAAGSERSCAEALSAAFEVIFSLWAKPNHRDPALSLLPYPEYLLTQHWREMRTRALLRAGFRCSRCEAEGVRLDVHHLTYARLGREFEGDLIVLCGWCHADEHGVPRS